MLRRRGEPRGDRSPRGTPAIRHPSQSETVSVHGLVLSVPRPEPSSPRRARRDCQRRCTGPPNGRACKQAEAGVCGIMCMCVAFVCLCVRCRQGSAPTPQSSSPARCLQRGRRPRGPGRMATLPRSPFSTGPAPPCSLPPWSTSIPCEPWRSTAPSATLGDAPAPVGGSGGHPFWAWGCGGGRLSPGAVTVVGGTPSAFSF